jgi:hypothetical protein
MRWLLLRMARIWCLEFLLVLQVQSLLLCPALTLAPQGFAADLPKTKVEKIKLAKQVTLLHATT